VVPAITDAETRDLVAEVSRRVSEGETREGQDR
jgi:hypothetical protein